MVFLANMDSQRPERIVYLLTADERRRVRCEILLAKLLNWKAFRPAPIERLVELMAEKYAGYRRDADRRILSRMMPYETREGGEACLDGPDGWALLHAMVETGRVFLADGNRLRAAWGDPRPATPAWIRTREGTRQTVFQTDPPAAWFIATQPPCYVDTSSTPNLIGPLQTDWPDALASDWVKMVPADEDAVRLFCLRLFNRYPDYAFPAPEGPEGEAEESRPPTPRLRILRRDADTPMESGVLHDLNAVALARLSFLYGPREVGWDDERPTVTFEEDGRLCRCRRDFDAEKQVCRQLAELGFERTSPEPGVSLFDFHGGDFQLGREAPHSWRDLLKSRFAKLAKAGWRIDFEPGFRLEIPAATDWFSRLDETRDGWFSFSAGIRYGEHRIQALPILRDFLHAHRRTPFPELRERFAASTFVVTPGGPEAPCLLVPGQRLTGLLDGLFELRGGSLDARGTLPVSRWRAAELVLDAGAEPPCDLDTDRLARLRKYLGKEHRLVPPPGLPAAAEALRDYQKTGLAWMEFLRETGTHGILADDMGLGKTRQVLVHLLYEKTQGRLTGPALVVTPTSVIDNWIRESGSVTPALSVHRHYGKDREDRWAEAAAADVVVTSYPLLRQDARRFLEAEWSFAVLDEAQVIKNPRSRTARIAGGLKAHRRLSLSGTPIENHLGELWAHFHFLMPGYLGTAEAFREQFRRPIENEAGDESRGLADLLSRRVTPFILRRRKEDVARELPPKTEVTHAIELSPKQSEAYEALRLRLFRDIRKVLEERGLEQSQVFILDALLQLRLVCCDPRLVREGGAAFGPDDSAKLQRLLEMLDELLSEGRRVLVFSQFVRVLDLVGEAMDERAWPYLRLTGETVDRTDVTARFERGEIPVFLISLKAGGVGLNLTAADTVIHYDPWWNPAVEAQATDRAHRIGQDKPVFVHRLIAEETVEAKILDLHARKRALVDSLLAGRTGDRITLDEDALADLFGEETGNGVEGPGSGP